MSGHEGQAALLYVGGSLADVAGVAALARSRSSPFLPAPQRLSPITAWLVSGGQWVDERHSERGLP
jgi:hypothetical protein